MPKMYYTATDEECAWVKAMARRLRCHTGLVVRIALNNWVRQELNGEGTDVENEVPGKAAQDWAARTKGKTDE